MIFGLSAETYTLIHVVISLIGVVSGLMVVYGMIGGQRLDTITALFLISTAATTLTGFGFPFVHLMPSHKIGILSLLMLAIAVVARYVKRLAGAWCWIYVVSAMLALYFNTFVLVAQAFLKVPALKALAPTETEPPFVIAQLAVLVLFVVLGVLSVKKFRSDVVA